MYPTLRHLFFDLTEIDLPILGLVQMTGLFMLLALLTASLLFYLELKRRAELGSFKGNSSKITVGNPLDIKVLAFYLFIGALLGYKGIDLMIRPGLYTGPAADKALWSIREGSWWGALVLAVAFGLWQIWKKDRELKQYPKPEEITQLIMPHHKVIDLLLMLCLAGFAGAKLLYFMEFGAHSYVFSNLFSLSGLNIYGGLVAIIALLLFYAYRKAAAPLQLLDSIAPSLCFAYGLGRLGGHLGGNGYWGLVAQAQPPSGWPIGWSSTYPNNLANKGIPIDDCGGYLPSQGDYCLELGEAVYSIGLWEFWASLLCFSLLWALRKQLKIEGLLFAIFLFSHALMRWQIEGFRVEGFSLNTGMSILILVIAIGLGLFLFWQQLRSHPPQTD